MDDPIRPRIVRGDTGAVAEFLVWKLQENLCWWKNQTNPMRTAATWSHLCEASGIKAFVHAAPASVEVVGEHQLRAGGETPRSGVAPTNYVRCPEKHGRKGWTYRAERQGLHDVRAAEYTWVKRVERFCPHAQNHPYLAQVRLQRNRLQACPKRKSKAPPGLLGARCVDPLEDSRHESNPNLVMKALIPWRR